MSARPHPNAPAPVLARLLAVLLAALLAVSLASPAQAAARRSVTDAERDVLRQVDRQPPTVAPRNGSADVVRFTTVMARNKLVLQTSVRRLPKNFWAMLWQVRTDTGAEFSLDLMRTGEVRFGLSQAGVDLPCEGLARKIDARRSRVTVAVPLACLGTPTSVRTGAGAAATARDFSRIYTDDAQRAGAFEQGRLRLGRPVERR